MDRQAKKSAKTQAEKEVNAMVEEHPFGPIENTLIVGYYRRSGFRPDRVRVCKSKALVFEVPTAAVHPIYTCIRYQTSIKNNGKKEVLRDWLALECSIDSNKLWTVMREQKLEYQITIRLAEADVTEHQLQAEPHVLIEFLHSVDGTVVRSHKLGQYNWMRLRTEKEIRVWIDRFFGSKHLKLRVTRDCVALWVDGELRQQLTRLKPLNHHERTALGPCDDLLNTHCLSLKDCDGGAKLTKQYFRQLLEYIVQEVQQLKVFSDSWAADSLVTEKVELLKSVVDTIQFCYIRPFRDSGSFEFLPIGVLTETVAILRNQLDEVNKVNKQLISYLQPSFTLLLLSAKNLLDEFDDVLEKTLYPKLDGMDPETLDHERMLYFISTPGFDKLFEIVLAYSDIFGLAEDSMNPLTEEVILQEIFCMCSYEVHLGYKDLTIVHKDREKYLLSRPIPVPKALPKWHTDQWIRWGNSQEDLIVIWHKPDALIWLLDCSAAKQCSLQPKKISDTKCWISPPKLDLTNEEARSVLPLPTLVFGKCFFLPVAFKSKIRIYFWSWKKQPNPKKWTVLDFDYHYTSEGTKMAYVRKGRGYMVFVVIPRDTKKHTRYQILAFSKDAPQKAPSLMFDQILDLFSAGSSTPGAFSWMQKQGRVFLLTTTCGMTRSRLHYLHNDKFVRIGDDDHHAPGFRRFIGKQPRLAAFTVSFNDPDGDRVLRTLKVPSKTAGFERLLITCPTVGF